MGELYDTDPMLWADAQIRALQRLADRHPELLVELDVQHLVEELDDIKRSVERELISRLILILAHLAKWRWQAGYRSRGWANTIGAQRDQLAILLKRHPGIEPHLPAALADECPFTLDQTLADGWLPD